MTRAYRRTDAALQRLRRHRFPKGFIELSWVHAHDDSALNDMVDGYAKAAALIVKYLYCPYATTTPLFSVNGFIGLQTAKRESKALVSHHAETRWNDEVSTKAMTRKTKKDVYRWMIPKRKDYGKELEHLNMKEAVIRMMLYTCTLPLNYWRMYSGHCDVGIYDTEFCEQEDCEGALEHETMRHFLMECPAFEVEREMMKSTIIKIQRAHNRKSRHVKGIKAIKVITDWSEKRILNKILFPSKRMAVEDRMDIVKAVIDFVDQTERFDDILKFEWRGNR